MKAVSALGLIIGFFLGANYMPSFAVSGRYASILIFLALFDEVVAVARDDDRAIAGALIWKAVFCGGAIWLDAKTGLPLLQFASIAVLWSILNNATKKVGTE